MFTGQWADLPLAEMARKSSDFGYDGLELACWGDHFEVDKALDQDGYCAKQRELLDKHDLQVLRHQRPPGRPGGVGPRSTRGIRRSCRRRSGATAIRPASTPGPPRN